ncbi:unnamed protein product [Symbiodinium sp. CCMP2592]|nr:unnamed protein product [Symbiodinium sp. CCMP2592]
MEASRRSLLPVLLLSAAVLLVSELGRAFQAPPAPRTAVAPPSRVATPPLEAAPFAGKSTPVYEALGIGFGGQQHGCGLNE